MSAQPPRRASTPDLDTTSAPAAVLPRPAAQAEAPAVPADTGEWGPVLDWGVQAKHMAALSTGKVLVWSTGANARVWDPTTGLFTLTPATFGDLHCAGQSTLADGRVIVVGGQKDVTHAGTNITALFDPLTETWTRGQDMTDLRWYASSTTLADGRVLATSGDAPDGSRSPVPEVYDPATDSWTRLTGAERPQSLYPLMFVLPNGLTYDSGPKSATAIYDTSGVGSETAGPTAPYSTSGYSESAVMYRPGKILRAGGGDPSTTNANVIDMTAASPAWRAVAPMTLRATADEPHDPRGWFRDGHRRDRFGRQPGGGRAGRGDLGPGVRDMDHRGGDDRGSDVPLVGGDARGRPSRRRRR